ncbi:MAG: DUF1851 domain-containing protein [Sphingomonadales bacterium]|nr:DUF1851 domain-containing protein [Sphingomonadales bacterium]
MVSESEVFEMFDQSYVTKQKYAEFDAAARDRLASRLPPILLALLGRDGFCSYNDGFLWTCDPDEWNGMAQPWFPKRKGWESILRTAFGETFLWNGKEVWLAKVNDAQTVYCAARAEIFLAVYLTLASFLKDSGRLAEFKKALRKIGPIAADEVYIWVPSLLIGGDSGSSKIDKGKAAVALDILSQQAKISIVTPD